MLARKQKTELLQRAGMILDECCADCEKSKSIIHDIAQKSGYSAAKHEAAMHCRYECPVGKRLQEIGRFLGGADVSKQRRRRKKKAVARTTAHK